MAEPVLRYVLTAHARLEMQRRSISAEIVQQVLAAPQQRIAVRPGRDLLQSRVTIQEKTYLVRVFVDVDREPAEVVTVYRTGKIEKYWRNQP